MNYGNYPENWGNKEKSAMGAMATNINKRNHHQKSFDPRPDWLDMMPVKRYRYLTRYMKLCPNGECYYECFFNSDIDGYEKKRGFR